MKKAPYQRSGNQERGMNTNDMAAPAMTVQPMMRSQALVYRHACRHEPVTQNPASGTTAAITTR